MQMPNLFMVGDIPFGCLEMRNVMHYLQNSKKHPKEILKKIYSSSCQDVQYLTLCLLLLFFLLLISSQIKSKEEKENTTNLNQSTRVQTHIAIAFFTTKWALFRKLTFCHLRIPINNKKSKTKEYLTPSIQN